MGSGNAGASNVTSELGWKYGIITGVSDVLKAFIPTYFIVFIFILRDSVCSNLE